MPTRTSKKNPSKAVYIGTGIVAAAAVLYLMMKKDEMAADTGTGTGTDTGTDTSIKGSVRAAAGEASVAEIVVAYLDGARGRVSAEEANGLAATGYFFYNALGTALTERATSAATGAGFSIVRPKKTGTVQVFQLSGSTTVSREDANEIAATGQFQWNAMRDALISIELLRKHANSSATGRGMSF